MSKQHRVTVIAGKPILRVYTGRAGCACGCRGKYSSRPATISRVVRAMMRYPMGGDFGSCGIPGMVTEIEGCCFTVDYTTPSGTTKTMSAYYDSAD